MKTQHFDEVPVEKPPFSYGAGPPAVRKSRVFRRSALANGRNAREGAGSPSQGHNPDALPIGGQE